MEELPPLTPFVSAYDHRPQSIWEEKLCFNQGWNTLMDLLCRAVREQRIPIVDGSLIRPAHWAEDGIWLKVEEKGRRFDRLFRWSVVERGGEFVFEVGSGHGVRVDSLEK